MGYDAYENVDKKCENCSLWDGTYQTYIPTGNTESNQDEDVPAHSHVFYAEFLDNGRVKFGTTDEVLGHVHKISGTVVTDIAELATQFSLTMDEIVEANVLKLSSRKERSMLHGSGDDR